MYAKVHDSCSSKSCDTATAHDVLANGAYAEGYYTHFLFKTAYSHLQG